MSSLIDVYLFGDCETSMVCNPTVVRFQATNYGNMLDTIISCNKDMAASWLTGRSNRKRDWRSTESHSLLEYKSQHGNIIMKNGVKRSGHFIQARDHSMGMGGFSRSLFLEETQYQARWCRIYKTMFYIGKYIYIYIDIIR